MSTTYTSRAIMLYLVDSYRWSSMPASEDEICNVLIMSAQTARKGIDELIRSGEIDVCRKDGKSLYLPSKEFLDGKPCVPRVVTKTPADVEELKRQWSEDPHWDLAETEGFEAHREELAEEISSMEYAITLSMEEK